MSVKLHVVMATPGKEPREFDYEFEKARISLGRDDNNDIQIPLSTVSRNHATLYEERGEWYLEDLKSTHGTRHNGRQVGAGGKKLLRNGDVIEVVHFRITFTQGEPLSEDYSQGRTEALAQRMVQEVLASMGTKGSAPYLRVMNGPDEGTQFTFDASMPEVTIGRGTDCDFQINDANISRRHAVVRLDWNDITIEDLGSKNGVVINDKKIKGRASLRDADEVLLGAVRLTFIDPSAKFIGKLDDIPAFQDSTGDEEPESSVSERLDAPDLAGSGPGASGLGTSDLAPPAESTASEGGVPDPDAPGLTESPAPPEGADPEAGGAPEGEPLAEPDPRLDPEDATVALTAEARQGFGGIEYAMIALVVLTTLGLLIGLYVLLG